MKRTLHALGAGLLGVILGAGLLGAVYNQFSPGGALTGTWNSQTVNLASGAFITGTLPASNGGTGQTAATDDAALVGNGTAFATSAIPNCTDTGGNHLNYATASNAFSCGTSGSGGATVTTGSWTTSLSVGCTVAQNQAWVYTQLNSGAGSVVTISTNTTPACTSNSGAFSSASGSVPAAIRPTNNINFTGVNGTDNGAAAGVCLQLLTDGTLAYLREGNSDDSCGATTFTTSGVKAVNMGTTGAGNRSFTYRID